MSDIKSFEDNGEEEEEDDDENICYESDYIIIESCLKVLFTIINENPVH